MRQVLLAAVVALSLPIAAPAQMRLDVSGVGATQYPIAIANFVTDTRVPEQVADVVRSDLARSGSFRVIDPGVTLSESAAPDYASMRSRGADAILGGSVARLPDGRYDIRYRLGDAVRQAPLGGESLVVSEHDLRFGGHRVADWVFERITGEKGIFSTRIAFVSKQGTRFKLNVADWDGENVVSPLTSPEPIISPSWSPDGTRIAYVSFESKKPVVYVHTLSTGQRVPVANFKGSNSAPAWSPDGRTLAVALTRDGLSQIYLIDADGSGTPRRLTTSPGIDTEPAFAPDGKALYFTSDRGGSPQIYRMPLDGGAPARVTFGSSYNVSPRVSPDGRLLAYVTRRDGRFLVAVRDLAGSGQETTLSETGREESPSFAPNSRWVMFATQINGRDSLVAITVDGRVRQRLTSSAGDIREPTWGPFPK
ncbi:MAG: Tol-Pal system beta propeller repeat protein TolB [Burkholderiaceae bacterium]|jgi:TolB protein|nr:Tol-Pal system beta propeller repeat protein TolB [Burkholderiaceae bacterium]